MKRLKNRTMKLFCVYAMVLLFFLSSYAISPGEESEVSKVIFYVH